MNDTEQPDLFPQLIAEYQRLVQRAEEKYSTPRPRVFRLGDVWDHVKAPSNMTLREHVEKYGIRAPDKYDPFVYIITWPVDKAEAFVILGKPNSYGFILEGNKLPWEKETVKPTLTQAQPRVFSGKEYWTLKHQGLLDAPDVYVFTTDMGSSGVIRIKGCFIMEGETLGGI